MTMTIDAIIALAKGDQPTFDPLHDMAVHVKANQSSISAFQAGSTPGWAAPIDLRWIMAAAGTNAYSATPAPSPSSSDTLVDGMRYSLRVTNRNTSRTCTLNLGSSEGAVPIKVVSSFGVVTDPYIGDLKRVHHFLYDSTLNNWICLNPQGYKRTILAAEMAVDNGTYANSASPDNIGRIATFSFPAGAVYACWLRPLILPDATQSYVIELNGAMETAETSKNIKFTSDVHLYTEAGDWSDTTAEETGVDDDISVPDDAASRFTHVGVNMLIPAADLTEDNMFASVALSRSDATTSNHGGVFHLIDAFIREAA